MASEKHLRRMIEQAGVTAGIDVGVMWERLLGEFLGKWDELNRQGLSAQEVEREMEAFLKQLSRKPVEDLARRSAGVAYNQGRVAEILSQFERGRVDFVIRSEVLDQNTCPPCRRLDSQDFEVGTPEFFEFQPPAKCEGGSRCRGFYVAIGSGDG